MGRTRTMNDVFFLGIDGGGTRCRARLIDQTGRRLGEGISGPSNLRLGVAQAWSEVDAAISAALIQSGLPQEILSQTYTVMGMAGAHVESYRLAFASAPNPFPALEVHTDSHIACIGAFDGAHGAILVVGTGSGAYVVSPTFTGTVGGWGFEVSDDGSAAVLGRDAIRAGLRGFEGFGPSSSLTEAVMARFNKEPFRIVEWAESARPTDYAAFAPLVFEAALQGDPVAEVLVTECARQQSAIIRRVRSLGAEEVCLVGGMADPITPWLPPTDRAVLVRPKGDALDGALLLSRRLYATIRDS